MNNEIEQIHFDRLDKLRIEIDNKLDKKIDKQIVFWFTGILITISLAVMTLTLTTINKSSDRLDLIGDKLARLETKIDDIKV